MANDTVYAKEEYTPDVKYANDNADTTITIDTATLKFLDKGAKNWLDKEAAWVGFRITLPTVGSSDDNVIFKLTFTRPDGTSKEYFNGTKTTLGSGSKYDVVVPITVEDLQKAVLGDGTITMKYVLTWNISKTGEKNMVEETAEVNQNVIIKIDANKIAILDARTDSDTKDKELWNADKATIYKMTNPAATETEENETTEGNKKDDVPKTGEVIQSDKSIRRRQRQRRRSNKS